MFWMTNVRITSHCLQVCSWYLVGAGDYRSLSARLNYPLRESGGGIGVSGVILQYEATSLPKQEPAIL